jgi:ubiquinol-cytochrome c reductase cytochrome c1 subunit
MMRAMKNSLTGVLLCGALLTAPGPASAAGDAPHIDREWWSFAGFRGQFDKAQLQRGFQVYKDVCSGCHGLDRVYFRNLVEEGGPEFPEESVKALAAEWPNLITDGPDDEGKMFERPAKLFDPIRGPYKNDKEARALQNGALPPDLSLMAKARNPEYTGPVWWHPFHMLRDILTGYQEGGADYLYALLTGYADEPPLYKAEESGHLVEVSEDDASMPGVERCASVTRGEGGKADTCNKLQDGMLYNAAFPGHQIAMPTPLVEGGSVTYEDGTGSLEDNARDVSAFMAWAADPSLNERKSTGWLVMLYLFVTTLLLYIGKKRIWARIH